MGKSILNRAKVLCEDYWKAWGYIKQYPLDDMWDIISEDEKLEWIKLARFDLRIKKGIIL